jgi:predicted permease
MDAILRDIRYGFRSLIKSPGLTFVATLALTLGIALTTIMFSMVYGVLLKGLPFTHGDRIVEVIRTNLARGARQMSTPISDYADFKTQQHTLGPIAAYYSGTVNVSGKTEPQRFTGSFVTASTFDVSGVRPLLGRTFRAGEDSPSGEKVVVISYPLWQSQFGGSPDALGTVIRANGVPYTVIGVMPEGYDFPDNARIWLPLQTDPVATKRGDGVGLTVAGVLKPGVTMAEATSDFSAIARRLQKEYKATNDGIDAQVKSYVDAELGQEPRQLLFTMFGAVVFVLLIACANVANLLLDRAAHRTKEVGIRTALGASRAAVVRQFLTEALLLSLGGAVFGSLVAYAGISAFNRVMYASADIPWFIDVRLNAPVLAFAIGMAALAAMFSGLLPAIQSSRTDINEVLKDESRGSSSLRLGRTSRALVVFEIALSCGLLVAAGLTIKSVTNLETMDPGYRTSHVFTARVGFPAQYTDTVMQRQFFEHLRDRLETIPGVRSAAITSGLPGVASDGGPFQVEGAAYTTDNDVPNARSYSVSAGFFETFAIRVLQGRGITTADRLGASPVVVVNQAFADKYFGGGDVLGKRIRQGAKETTQPWMTIVGLVPTTFTGDQDEPRAPAYFIPFSQHPSNFASIAAVTDGPPMAITSQVRTVVASLNRDIPIYFTYSQEEAMARKVWFIRVFGTMFMIFGFIALFLAAIGLYAVMSFSVSRRVREMGIRMALGAQARDVVRIIVRQGILQIVIGIVAGLAFAATLAQFLGVVLFQVQPRDPVIFGSVAAVLGLTGLAACLIPALRATTVDPLTALRAE